MVNGTYVMCIHSEHIAYVSWRFTYNCENKFGRQLVKIPLARPLLITHPAINDLHDNEVDTARVWCTCLLRILEQLNRGEWFYLTRERMSNNSSLTVTSV